MARKRKPQMAWGIVDASDYIWEDYLRRTRIEAIAAWCEGSGWTWERWRRQGRRCVKIRLEVLPDAD